MSYGKYPDFSKIKKILVIKMRHHGDVLLTSPIFSTLKRRYPNVEIDALLYAETVPMLEGLSEISRFHLYDRRWKKKGFFGRLKEECALLWRIRKSGYDLVLNLTEGDRGAIVSAFSGAAFKVGFDPEGKGFRGKKKIYSHIVKNCKSPRHAVERNLDALRVIGIFPAEHERALSFEIPQESRKRMEEFRDCILIHPVSRWRFKCLPPKTIAQLIDHLLAQGHRVVLSASPDPIEMVMIGEILSLVKLPGAKSLAGQLSLKDLGALIAQSRCLITVDSVPLHLASALKTAVVALFGPTSEQNWGPWQHPHSRVITQSLPCRPCFMDGCGGSKMSDCLFTLKAQKIAEAVEELTSLATLHLSVDAGE